MAKHRAPSFMGLYIASIILRLLGLLCVLLGFILTILILTQANEIGLAGTLMATMPGLAILMWGIFIVAAGEALNALKVIAESTDETAYVLRRKLMK
jgi:hypothetical protein